MEPRSAPRGRQRRSTDETGGATAETQTLVRVIEVLLPKDEDGLPLGMKIR